MGRIDSWIRISRNTGIWLDSDRTGRTVVPTDSSLPLQSFASSRLCVELIDHLTMLFTDLKPAEYERRLATIQRLMTEQKLDALFLCNEASFRYFTGHISLRWMNTLMPLSAVVPRKGKPSVMMSAAEVAIAEHNPAIGRVYAVTGDQRIGVPQMKQALLDLGVSAGRVGHGSFKVQQQATATSGE